MLETWCSKLVLDSEKRATAVVVETKDGQNLTLRAKHEIVLSAGAVDTPRLLLHSGIGPAGQLHNLGISVKHDLPGVGENLLDHPERYSSIYNTFNASKDIFNVIFTFNLFQHHYVGD
jgi:choline dehydrogenase